MKMTKEEFTRKIEKARQRIKEVESDIDTEISESEKEAISSFLAFDSAFSLISELCEGLDIDITSVEIGTSEKL